MRLCKDCKWSQKRYWPTSQLWCMKPEVREELDPAEGKVWCETARIRADGKYWEAK